MLREMAPRVSSARFVGRVRELQELEAALAEAAAGRPSVVLVAGDSGVGKSRLVRELTARTEATRVLWGDCVELGEGELPFAPLIAALRPLARDGDPALTALPDAVRAELGRLLPVLGPPPAATAEDPLAQTRLFESLLALLHGLGTRAPVLFVIEDIHWADRSTRALLAFLSRALLDERVLVLATYRADELHRRHPLRPLLAELRADARNVRRIEVAPFTAGELGCALEDILGGPPAPGLAERLFARSEGNPLFTEELLAAQPDGRGPAPRTLRDALIPRIERLGPGAQTILRVLAVARRLDHEGLRAVSELPEEELRAGLREAIAAQLVLADAEGRHGFRHALLREVAYDDLLPGERGALHRTLAAVLEARVEAAGSDAQLAAAIAHHQLAAGDQEAALAASVRAAGAADRVGAHGEAGALLERALELWDRVPAPERLAGFDHVALLTAASHQHGFGPDLGRREALLRRALSELDTELEPARAAVVLEALSRTQWWANRGEEALASVATGLDLVPPSDPPVGERGSLLAWLARARMLQGRYSDTIRAAREARAIAEALGDDELRGRALNPLGVAEMASGAVPEGVAVLREALTIARERGALLEIGSVGTNLADRLHLAGRSEEALAVARSVIADFAPTGVSHTWVSLLVAEIAFETGDWEECRRILGSLRGGASWSPAVRLNAALRRAELVLAQGEHGAAAQILEEHRGIVEESTEPQFLAPYGVLLAQLRRRTGELDAALAAAEETLDRLEFCTEDVMRLARISVVGVAVEADRAQRARDLGDPEAERAAVQGAEIMWARAAAAASGGGPVEAAWLLAAEAHRERARTPGGNPARYRKVAEAWRRLGRGPLVASHLWRAAESHAGRGEAEEASGAAAEALGIARGLGALWLVGELESLVARARLAAPGPKGAPAQVRAAPEEPFGLTARERQVLALVAGGATNREVGERLFMAEKTASVHVSRILRKLGVSSRTQAAAVAHRMGLEQAGM